MNEEEKKAWDRLQMMKTFIVYDSDEDEENQEAIRDIEAIDIILNLLEKQQKEIEELQFKNRSRILGKYGEPTLDELIKENYISKDKIRELIENREYSIDDIKDNFIINEGMVLEVKRLEAEIQLLQELLEE